MKTHFQSVTIYDPNSPWHNKIVDIVQDGSQTKIENSGTNVEADVIIPPSNFYATPGWIDALSFCGEPGEEWREDLESLANAGAAGGYTRLAAVCGNHPSPDSATAIQAILSKAVGLKAQILPIGLASKDGKGAELTEIYEMKKCGAIAFTDYDFIDADSGQKARLLEYAYNCQAPVVVFPFKANLAHGGMMHEGIVSSSLGLKGIPAVSEEISLQEYISLCKWLKLPLRISKISTAKSVELISQAQKDGLDIKAMIPIMNLLFTDESLREFDENFKVLPPLRAESDRVALINGLKSGIIAGVCSNHNPQDTENKSVEFDYAAFGASTLESAFSQFCAALGADCTPDLVYRCFVSGPADFLSVDIANFDNGKNLDFTVFSLTEDTMYSKNNSMSKSFNNPIFGQKMKGRVVATVSNGQTNLRPLTVSI